MSGWVTQLGHRPSLDLADALTGEVEVLAHLLERAGLAAVEAEAEAEDLALPLVERGEQAGDLLGEQCGGGHLEGGLGRAVLDDVTQLGVAVLTERLGQRERLGREAQRLGDLVLGHLEVGRQLGERGRTAELELEAARAFCRRASVSPAWTGSRIVRPVLAMPRVMAWRIHHVAYVENLKPLRQSNFSTACMRPRLPSWMRSRRGRPEAWYFFAIETTRRRFDCTNVRSASSPSGWPPQLTLAGRGEVWPRASRTGAGLVLPRWLVRGDLVILGEQWVLTDVGEIQANEIFLVALYALLRQGAPSRGTGLCVTNDTDAVKRTHPEVRPPLIAVRRSASHRGGRRAP